MKELRKIVLFAAIVICGMLNCKLAYASDGWGSFGSNISWNYTESSGLLEIKGSGDMPEERAPWGDYKGGIKKVIIGEGITSVSRGLFQDYKKLTEVRLPTTVKKIADWAFNGCVNLNKVNLPNTLEEIGDYAFQDSSITSIVIPGTVKEIGAYAFSNEYYSSLTDITLQEGVEKIGACCFKGAKIKTISIPSSVKTIDGWAFYRCSNMLSVEIPENVLGMGNSFEYCEKLRYVIVNAAADLHRECFSHCDSLEMVKLGDAVKSIGYDTFYDCDSLKAIYVPQSVSSIDDSAFGQCGTVTFYGFTGSAAWDYAGKHSQINFIDVSTADGKKSWDALWTECVNRKEIVATNSTSGNSNTNQKQTTKKKSTKKSIKTLTVKAKKGKKSITIKTLKGCKIVVTMNKKIMKSGKKNTKKKTIKKCGAKTIIKLSKKLPKNTKITIRVTKSGYKARSRMLVIK